MKSFSPSPTFLVAWDVFSILGIYKCSTIFIQKLLLRIPLARCLANLITSLLHGDHPPGILVRVGVAVVLQVWVVPLYHHTELAVLRTPGKAGEVLSSIFSPRCRGKDRDPNKDTIVELWVGSWCG